MSRLDRHVATVQNKLALARFFQALAWGIIALGLAVWLAILIDRLIQYHLPGQRWWLLGGIMAVVVGSLAWAIYRRPGRIEAAAAIDQTLGTQDQFATALYVRPSNDPFARAAVLDAERTADHVSLHKRFPLSFPRPGYGAILVLFAAFLTALLLPSFDLFGHQQALQKQALEQRKVEQAREAVKSALAKVNAVPKAAADEKVIEQAKHDLAMMLQKPITDPAKAHRSALQALQNVNESMRQQVKKSERFATAQQDQKLFKSMAAPTADKGPVRDAHVDLMKGDFVQAAADLQQAAEQFTKEEPKQQQQMAQQMQQLARQIQKAAQDPKQQQQMQQQLQKMGMNQQQAQQMAQQMQQAAQGNQQAQQQVQKMAQQLMQQAVQQQGLSQKQQQAIQQQIQQAVKQMQGQANSQAQAQQLAQAAQQMAQAMQQAAQQQQQAQKGQPGKNGQAQNSPQGQQGKTPQQQQQMAAAQQQMQQQLQQMAAAQQAIQQQQAMQQAMQQAAQQQQQAMNGQGQQPGQQPGGQQANAQQPGGNQPGQAGQNGQPGGQPGGQQGNQPGNQGQANGQGGQWQGGNPKQQGQGGQGGPAQAMGQRPAGQAAPYGVKAEQAPTQDIDKGKVLASYYVNAPSKKGESHIRASEIQQATEQEVTDEIEQQRIPRQVREAVKDYFDFTEQPKAQ